RDLPQPPQLHDRSGLRCPLLHGVAAALEHLERCDLALAVVAQGHAIARADRALEEPRIDDLLALPLPLYLEDLRRQRRAGVASGSWELGDADCELRYAVAGARRAGEDGVGQLR